MENKIFMNTIKKLLSILICVALSVICVIFSSKLSDGTAEILQDSFILSFLGLFSGLAIACITFMFANIEKISYDIHTSSQIVNPLAIDTKIDTIVHELKQDTISTIFTLVICLIVILLRDLDFNVVSLKILFFTKQQVISIIEIFSLMVTIGAIYDITVSLFGLNEVLLTIKRNVDK